MACKSEGPQREAAQPRNLYWIYSFPIYRPHTPHREEVSAALSLSPKTMCYGTHMSTHNRVNTHTHTHSQKYTDLVYLQGTLPHSKEVITAHFLSLWELHRGQGILRCVRDRQVERIIQAIDTVSYLRLTIVSLMEKYCSDI